MHILLTHLHLDHLQGLGFFRPLFRPGADVHIWGPASPVQSLAERIAIYLSPPLFPVRLADVPANVTFHDASEEPWRSARATVRAANGRAPGPDRRLPHRGGRPIARVPPRSRARRSASTSPTSPPTWISGHDVARDVDVLFHDAQYGDHEYPHHVGWGTRRSSTCSASRRRPTSGTVVLFHHDPYHTDDELEALLAESHQRWETDHEWVCLAHEGMVVMLDADGVRARPRRPCRRPAPRWPSSPRPSPDFETEAGRRAEPDAWDYLERGSGRDLTLHDNLAAWDRWRLLPRVLRDVTVVDTSTVVLGANVDVPILVAPTAMHRMFCDDGELATAPRPPPPGAS